MSRLKRSRSKAEPDVDIDMVPVMNMFLVLIPFLLMSASFLHLKAVNTSVPVRAETLSEAPAEKDPKITVIVRLQETGIRVSALSDALDEAQLKLLAATIGKDGGDVYPFERMIAHLKEIKNRYPSSDTMIVIPEQSVLYETIIETMDAARTSKNHPLFPNVVLSGQVG